MIHTASPFHFNVTDPKKDLLDPAVIGTTGILKAIKKSAPTVKRVVITSSFAAIVAPSVPKGHRYSEQDWNPITEEEAIQNPMNAYRGSKTFAEKAAWDFVEKKKPNFTIATVSFLCQNFRLHTDILFLSAIHPWFSVQSYTTSIH